MGNLTTMRITYIYYIYIYVVIYIYILYICEYYLVLKKNEITKFAGKWKDLHGVGEKP